jgi:hypothetical protein
MFVSLPAHSPIRHEMENVRHMKPGLEQLEISLGNGSYSSIAFPVTELNRRSISARSLKSSGRSSFTPLANVIATPGTGLGSSPEYTVTLLRLIRCMHPIVK